MGRTYFPMFCGLMVSPLTIRSIEGDDRSDYQSSTACTELFGVASGASVRNLKGGTKGREIEERSGCLFYCHMGHS